MAKLTKNQAKNHARALELLDSGQFKNEEEREFVFNNWNEGANHINGAAGAFFTPLSLAYDLAIDVGRGKVLDLCAGIGILSYAVHMRNYYDKDHLELTCVEINPDYVEIGKKLVPQANWICADALDILDLNLGHFDAVISNPPFGNIKRSKNGPKYTGKDFEYHIIDIASQIADYGVFIVPQMSAGFNYSGRQYYERQADDSKAGKFQLLTGLHFDAGCGVDTTVYKNDWKGVSPTCEIVCVEFN